MWLNINSSLTNRDIWKFDFDIHIRLLIILWFIVCVIVVKWFNLKWNIPKYMRTNEENWCKINFIACDWHRPRSATAGHFLSSMPSFPHWITGPYCAGTIENSVDGSRFTSKSWAWRIQMRTLTANCLKQMCFRLGLSQAVKVTVTHTSLCPSHRSVSDKPGHRATLGWTIPGHPPSPYKHSDTPHLTVLY